MRIRRILCGLLLLGWAAGCDSLSFVPPRPTELAGGPSSTAKIPAATAPGGPVAAPAGTTPVGKARAVELLLSRPATGDRELLDQILRIELGKAKLPFRMAKPEDGKPFTAEQLAREIGLAVSRGVAVLILEPINAPEVLKAVHEAESHGVAILLLEYPLPSSQPNRMLPTISMTGFRECAEALALTAQEDARLLGLPSDGEIVLIQNKAMDEYSKARQDSLRDAVKGLGRTLLVLEFEGDRRRANRLLIDLLKAHPRANVILTEEDYGLGGAVDLHRARSIPGPVNFILGGYASYDIRIDPEVAKRCCAFIERSLGPFALKIAELAQAAISGKPLPEQTKVELVFIRMEPVKITKPAQE